MAVLPSLGVRVTVAESLIRDLGRVSDLGRDGCSLAPVVWGIRIQPTFAPVRVVRGD